VNGEFVVVEGKDIASPQSFPDVYTRSNRFGSRFVSPAAGADISIPVPNGTFWDVNSLTALFTAGAAAANRLVSFVVKNQDGQIVYQYQFSTALVATNTCTFTFSEDYAAAPQAQGNGLFVLGPSPKPWFLPGWTFGTVTAGIQGADQWSAVTAWVEEYLPPAGE
jgi:hypothetical protein